MACQWRCPQVRKRGGWGSGWKAGERARRDHVPLELMLLLKALMVVLIMYLGIIMDNAL
jgi:hypothetical protein